MLDVICCVRLHTRLHVVGSYCAKFETSILPTEHCSSQHCYATTPNIVGPTMLGVVDQQCCIRSALTFFNHQKVTRKQGPLLPANSARLKLRTSHGFNVNVAFQNFRLFARRPFCAGFVKHHKTSALSITTIRIPGIHVSRSSSPLVACVQTSPLSQKETYFFLREGGRPYTG